MFLNVTFEEFYELSILLANKKITHREITIEKETLPDWRAEIDSVCLSL
jgi:hypothetical protein